MPGISGLSRQVVSWQWSLKTGFTVYFFFSHKLLALDGVKISHLEEDNESFII